MLNDEFINALDGDIIERFKRAVELGKWPDGNVLSDEQRQTCMQAIIVWEHKHLSEDERTGYVPPKEDPCAPKPQNQADEESPLKWK